MSAGKGDKPRNCFSKQYKDNYDKINWGNKFEDRLTKALKKHPEILKKFSKNTKNIKPTIKNNFIGI